jgi:hypothetical protein
MIKRARGLVVGYFVGASSPERCPLRTMVQREELGALLEHVAQRVCTVAGVGPWLVRYFTFGHRRRGNIDERVDAVLVRFHDALGKAGEPALN